MNPLFGNGPSPILPDYLYAGPSVGLMSGDARADLSHYNIDSLHGDIYPIVAFNKTGTDWFHELMKPAMKPKSYAVSFRRKPIKIIICYPLGILINQATYLNDYLKRFTTRVNTEFDGDEYDPNR